MAAPIPTDIIKKVSDIYEWIDSQILEATQLAGQCAACGKCCDFPTFGHKLFVTSPELLHFSAAYTAALKEITDGRCPYNIDRKCQTYEIRFAGCRIFSCNGDSDFQSRLTETTLKRFKNLCLEYEIPYRYMDLTAALNRPAPDTCR